MRRRSTFVHSANREFNPAEIQLKERQLLHPGLKAAREEKLTLGLKDLPSEIVDVLKQSHELHIRWSPESSPGSVVPFLSRLTPGLHVHFTPLEQHSSNLLCPLLKRAFSSGLSCVSPEISFSRPDVLSDRFAASSSLQYYSLLPSLNYFVAYVQRNICKQSDRQCFFDAGMLNIVDYLDLDYDSIAHALTLTAYWSKQPPAIYDPIGELTTLDQWPLDISAARDDRVEVGVLSSQPAVESHELQLAGFLTVLGEDARPKATQFSFPSRHHILPRAQASKQQYTVSFQKPTGLHPILEINFPSTLGLEEPTNKPAASVCALHAYFTLPSSIFADEYAFTAKDPLFEQSHNLRTIRSISGELDLEAPDYVVQRWGSAMLLELATPDEDASPVPDKGWKVTVPLHLRYQPPAEGGFDKIRMPWPVVFWACTAEEGTKFPVNPFDRINLGYDGVFGPRTMFYHLKPEPKAENEGRLVEEIRVPVLDTLRVGGDTMIEQGTLIVILLGFGWVLLKLWPGLSQYVGVNQASHKTGSRAQQKKQ